MKITRNNNSKLTTIREKLKFNEKGLCINAFKVAARGKL